MVDEDQWMTVDEACAHLKISTRTLYRYMESGDLPYYTVGGTGHRRLRHRDLDALLVKHHRLPARDSDAASDRQDL